MLTLVLFISLSIGVSFICSVLEAILLSITPSYLANLRQQEHPAAAKLTALKDNIDRPLASILTLNTIAHTVGAAGAGAQAANVFGDAWVGLFSGVLTLAILLLSEIIPKTIGANFWPQLAPGAAIVLKWMVWGLTPFVWVSEQITKRLSSDATHVKLRDEISAMAMLASESGEMGEDETQMLNNMLKLRELPATQLMTPRPVLFRVPAEMSVDTFLTEHSDCPFSRPLIYGEQRDDILGFVHKSDIYAAKTRGARRTTLGNLMRPLAVILPGNSVLQAFDILMIRRAQLAMIVDEYGTVQGIITLEDIFEYLTGREIIDEADTVTDMQQLAYQRWESWKKQHKMIESQDDDEPPVQRQSDESSG
ncbi:CNNM domain-containing protein [Salinivibrio sp. SS2]|uniref:CNNM domain-containing protein n=1 Tax=Salinivibrio sp. SS2 TaxID=1892894 RepID=UPI00084BC417|nr:hemolysin family protein [Salinivibrio sp. DV]ODQ01271.1 hemolysin [Salinivibrio sp. DV]